MNYWITSAKNFLAKIKFDRKSLNSVIDHIRIPITIVLLMVISVIATQMYEQRQDRTREETYKNQLNSLSEEYSSKLSQSEREKSDLQKAVDSVSTNTVSASSNTNLININSASETELDSLPGIGPVYAKRIVEYRQTSGGFKSVEEIKEIKGIGDATFAKLKNLISI